jgi:hypothetical protein
MSREKLHKNKIFFICPINGTLKIFQKKYKKCLTNKTIHAIIWSEVRKTYYTQQGDFTMYDYNITAQEIAAYNADMLEMAADQQLPTDEEMDAMAAYYGEG